MAPPRVDFSSPIPEGALPEVKGHKEAEFSAVHPLVPGPPCMWNLIGPTGTGKTTVVVKLLTTAGAWFQKFDRILYFVPTFYVDKNWALIVPKSKDCVFLEWDDETVRKLHKMLVAEADEDIKAGRKRRATLIVLDDSAGLQRSGPRMNGVDIMMALDRKINVSVVNMVQKWKGNLNSATRYNATHTSIFRLQSRDELGDVLKELCPPDVAYEEFEQMYLDAVMSGLGQFFHISRFSPVGHRFSVCFHGVYAL